eukprot:7713538-Lingulodinium_polyedra.AAC.1
MRGAFRRPPQDRTRPHCCRRCDGFYQLTVWRTPDRHAPGVAWCRQCRPLTREALYAALQEPRADDLPASIAL